jgi:hypothetical protein
MMSKISIVWDSLLPEYWHGLTIAVFDSYRPELHYMRGPPAQNDTKSMCRST